jgi:hypothetical protein
VANLLGRIERLFEDAVEGTSRRLFRAPVQPVELAKAASRQMRDRQLVGPDGPEVPNAYRIRLHPADYERFAPYRQSLQSKIERYLAQFADDRGWQPVADWQVELAADDAVRPRSVRVDARMTDPPTVSHPLPRLSGAVPEVTIAMGLVNGPADARGARLSLEDGRQFRLTDDATTIGRALDNDLVIADARVSRYHAEIRREAGQYLVRDLGSTNGTAVAGRRLDGERRLRNGDEFSLGGFTAVLRLLDD